MTRVFLYAIVLLLMVALLPLIIYFGKTGLESQVFQSYMASSGYKVQVVTNGEAATSAIDANPAAIAVVALDRKQNDLLDQARRLRRHADQNRSHIFVLSTEDTREAPQAGIDVIPRPYRLSELVRRIQAITKDQVEN